MWFESYFLNSKGYKIKTSDETNIKMLNTSSTIKSTGMSDMYFPIRIRFSAKGDTLKEVERSTKFVSDLLG